MRKIEDGGIADLKPMADGGLEVFRLPISALLKFFSRDISIDAGSLAL